MRLRPLRASLLVALAVMILNSTATGQQPNSPVRISFDFRNGSQGWQAGMADYTIAGNLESYGFQAEMRSLPAELGQSGTGFYMHGMNRSDDLFMFLKRRLGPADGIIANQKYLLYYTIIFASNAQSNCAGAGGSPGDSVGLKAGATSIEPLVIPTSDGWMRMNVNKDSAGGQGGPAASLVTLIANGLPCDLHSAPYISLQRHHLHDTLVTANGDGELWLLLGTDSGFEGLTTLFYQRIDVLLVPVSDAPTAPTLLTEENTERAVALDSVTLMREPFTIETLHNFSTDQRTRLTLFARNLNLAADEKASAVTAQAEDAQHRIFPLAVEYVGKVSTFNWLTRVIVKLPDELRDAGGDIEVSISLHGTTSNRARISLKPSSSSSH